MRKTSDKVLHDKAFYVAKTPKYNANQRDLALVVYNFFDKDFASLTGKSASDGADKRKICQTKNYLKN